MDFTDEQKQVINASDCNILVSAAAGSGKTAVLVERIIRLITGPDQVDIDHLLVVTFTRAAAAQMKERIMAAVEKKLEQNPGDAHLQRQETLIHSAQITTIDSFCQYIIRNNFDEADIDPSYRVADEGEIKLLQKDVMADFLEKKYAAAKEAENSEDYDSYFLGCSSYFSTGNSDSGLEDSIMQLYRYSLSMPWPEKWLDERSHDYDCNGNIDELDWMKLCVNNAITVVKECASGMQRCLDICNTSDGPYMYGKIIESEQTCLSGIGRAATYDELFDRLREYAPARLPSKKDDDVSNLKRKKVQEIRNSVKDKIKELLETYFTQTKAEITARMEKCAPALHELCQLTIEFKQTFDSCKKQKNIIDFSDMEHYALDILVKRSLEDDNEFEPTEVAGGYRKFFYEVMIDEYQDSNNVQEIIMQAVSGNAPGTFDRFMVGDVKQSIYRFRLARPEIFMEKLGRYDKAEDSAERRIDLHKNFRSRREVLDCVNYIFRRIMGKSLGGVDYDLDAMLLTGASYPVSENKQEYVPELIMVNTDEDDDSVIEENSNNNLNQNAPEKSGQKLTSKQKEAIAISARIKELMKSANVSDGDGGLRRVRYSDIVILLRATTGWDDVFRKVLEEEGIPAYVETKTGYFKAPEIETILQLLTILDNPLQDIPLVSVMHSSFGNFSDEELAIIKSYDNSLQRDAAKAEKTADNKAIVTNSDNESDNESEEDEHIFQNHKFYNIVKAFAAAENSNDTKLRDKCDSFLKKISNWRYATTYLTIHELLQTILDESGYADMAAAMPGGARRHANIEMLLEKASEYEKTSFHGLFHFIRYIGRLEKYEVDFGEANTLDENDDVVRIMSIHKSKGLEFPIVFLSGLGKRFNMRDTSGALITDVDMGIGTVCIDDELRVQYPTLRRDVIALKMKDDALGEELRVLYVAMTRAKEKLIMTTQVKKLKDRLASALSEASVSPELISFTKRRDASSYFDWVIAALSSHPSFHKLCDELEIDDELEMDDEAGGRAPQEAAGEYPEIEFRIVDSDAIAGKEITESVNEKVRKNRLVDILKEENEDIEISMENNHAMHDESGTDSILQKFGYVYPHENYRKLYTKTTVTELKEALLDNLNEGSHMVFDISDNSEDNAVIPDFISQNKGLVGAGRGIAYHKIMEKIEKGAGKLTDPEAIDSWIQAKVSARELPEAYADCVNAKDIAAFFRSDLGIRFAEAINKSALYREKQFMMGIPASRIDKSLPEHELVLVQGIIDAWFIEAGKIILLDYKTDHGCSGKELAERYGLQLDYYQEALERITGMKVAEKYIYSFSLGEAIRL